MSEGKGAAGDYWARPTESADKTEWQPLKDHLTEVADNARRFADWFGAGDVAEATGLCHDLGKYTAQFQRRLTDPSIRVDHSTAGAKEAASRYGMAGRLMAYAIAGHHSGLPNWSGGYESDLSYRLGQKEVEDHSPYKAEITPPASVTMPRMKPWDMHRGFTVSFFVRMLFSCLVDADCLDAEAFSDPEAARQRGRKQLLADLETQLMEHIRKISTKAPKTLVNAKRAEVLEDCLSAAALSPGLFTLTVPTGGGKTLSSLAFALKHCRLHGLRRVVYAIPFTSIIEQNARVFRDAVGEGAVLEHHSNAVRTEGYKDSWRSPLELAEQNWDMPLVATTNVQLMESLFSCRTSRCRKLHNVARSVIILDEAQMLPVDLLSPCVAAIYELITNYGATVVLCSATQPALGDLFPADAEAREIVRRPAELYEALKRVEVQGLGVVDDDGIVSRLREQEQALCIVNTRAHARKIFEELGESEGHFHLSAAMYPKHRARELDKIRARLKDGLVCRVVSTQLIEAGVDVDFPVVMRALSGIDSIAQAAGRCNREGRAERGSVFVFTPAGKEGLSHIWFRRTAAIASGILEGSEDPLDLGAVRRYFDELYFYERGLGESSGLDKHGILDLLDSGAGKLDFPFRQVDQLFRFIGEETMGIVVPADPECTKTLKEIQFQGVSRARIRRLNQYTVSVRPWELAGLTEEGLLEEVGGLAVLADLRGYDKSYGLVTGRKGRKGDEVLIV